MSAPRSRDTRRRACRVNWTTPVGPWRPRGSPCPALALRLRPNVVLTDIEMPRMTGLELAAELARRDRSIRVQIPLSHVFAAFYRHMNLATGNPARSEPNVPQLPLFQ